MLEDNDSFAWLQRLDVFEVAALNNPQGTLT